MMEKFKRFMMGRYGVDQLSNGLNFLFFILFLCGLIFKANFLFILGIIVLVFMYYRIFSKNFAARYNENRIYTNFMSPVYNLFDKIKLKFTRKKDKNYKYFKCKNCHQELRIPKGKGKVTITCPKCHTSFEGRS